MQTLKAICSLFLSFLAAIIVGIAVTVFVMLSTGNASAATLKTQFYNEYGDRICVYEKHFKEHYINAGFNGHCSFNIPDSELPD